jgi:hypothetical protein
MKPIQQKSFWILVYSQLVGILVVQQAHGVLCKQGLTFKLRLFASLCFGSGWTEFCWAFSCYLVLLFLYWASVPGLTINNALPAQSPVR